MAATQVWVQVPAIWKARHPEWGPIPVWVERVWEPEPPAGVEEPLEWIPAQLVAGADRGGIAPQAGVVSSAAP